MFFNLCIFNWKPVTRRICCIEQVLSFHYRLESNSNDLIEDVDQIDPEKNSEHFMAILIECLALLKKLPDAVEVFT